MFINSICIMGSRSRNIVISDINEGGYGREGKVLLLVVPKHLGPLEVMPV